MNNVVRGVLRYTVPMNSVIIEDYFDNEVYDTKTGFLGKYRGVIVPRNFFEYEVSGTIFGDYCIREATLNDTPMEMRDIAKLLDNDRTNITNIDYEGADFVTRRYLTISYDKVIKTDTGGIEVGDFVLSVANPHNISLNMMIHQMSHHDVFMRYFMERLKHNMPEVIIHNNLEPY